MHCKHGPDECLGNMLELCAAALYPDAKLHLGFALCLARDYARIPARDLVEDCALEHALDFARLNACVSRADGSHALALLRRSFERSARAGVRTSCTVSILEKKETFSFLLFFTLFLCAFF